MESCNIPRNRRKSTSIACPRVTVYIRVSPSLPPFLRLSLNPLAAALYVSASSRVAVRLFCRPSWLQCWGDLMATSSSLPIRLSLTIHVGPVCWLVLHHPPAFSCRRESYELRIVTGSANKSRCHAAILPITRLARMLASPEVPFCPLMSAGVI
ncbi:hypothetical protein K523DRAFT_119283 [Schizophyllum commune Tattone D]|nr:hypothetical protein K523DRAFT_119283 [Schizophyllum commune Tattone D]